MPQRIPAVYEHGVFRPLIPLPFAEQERVSLLVETGDEEWLDHDAHRLAEREPDCELSLDEIRAELGRVAGSWAEDFIAERGEY